MMLSSPARGPAGRPTLPIHVAAAVTLVLVAVWAWGALGGDDGGDDPRAGPPASTTTTAPQATTTTEAPLVEVEPGWPRKGMSRFGESEQSKQLRESLPTTSTSTTSTSAVTTSVPRRR
jgi:hypothetical protein